MGSVVTKRHCNNVAIDEASEHGHSEPIEWQEDSTYGHDDSKAKLVTLKDGLTIMASSYSSIFILCIIHIASYR